MPNINDALAFYTQKMGFKEVIKQTSPQGEVTAAYIQISRDTFMELQLANAQRPAGLNHFGLQADNIEAAVAGFRQRGATATDPGAPSAFTKARLANVTDPNGIRIELAEIGPDAVLRKAADSWK